MTTTTVRRFLLSTLLALTAACGSNTSNNATGAGGGGGATGNAGGSNAGNAGSGGATGMAGSGNAGTAGGGGATGTAGSGGATGTAGSGGADGGAAGSGGDGSAAGGTDTTGSDAGTDAVFWTTNGTSFTAPLTTTSYLQIVGTAPNASPVLTVSGVINGSDGFAKNLIDLVVTGPTGDGSIPAGTYNCNAFGTITMTAKLDGAGSALNLGGGSCAIVLSSPAVNGTTISGTFTGSLIGLAGTGGTAPTDMTITAGTFTFADVP